MIKIDHKCHYPFNPSSMVTILLFKKDGLEYIASDGEERCAWHFAKEIEITINKIAELLDCSTRTIHRNMCTELKREKELLNKQL